VLALADTPKAIGRIFNIGGSQEVTIQELAERVLAMTGSTSEIVYLPYEQAYEKGFEDMRRRVPNTTRLRETIGFAPDSDLDTILRRVIDYFQK
jgi:UDP-glucose 4-epimerase